MGCASGSSAKDVGSLPPQEVVQSGQLAFADPHRKDADLRTHGLHGQEPPSDAASPSRSNITGQAKLPFSWDQSTIKLSRVDGSKYLWNLTADFSTDIACELSSYFYCSEKDSGAKLEYFPRDGPPSHTVSFAAGTHSVTEEIDMKKFPVSVYWKYSKEQPDMIPIILSLTGPDSQLVMQLTVEPPPSKSKLSNLHLTPGGLELRAQEQEQREQLAKLEPKIRVLRRKAIVGGASYMLEDIYGLAEIGNTDAHDESSAGEPCVICFFMPRNTALVPCKHLCLCEQCAKELQRVARCQCPICRSDFKEFRVLNMGGAM